ncbi:MAG: LytTR family transcriptional regulator [Cytophagales bacterium]|nr:LytTR family transcriptional regulator [Cytophagales bacterium]
MRKRISWLDANNDRRLMICTVLVFSVFFVNIFKPWNIGRWHSDSGLVEFVRLSSYGFVVAGVLLFTQFPLRKWLRQDSFSLISYAVWVLIEISLISLVYIFMYGNPLGNFLNDFIFSTRYTFLGIMLPYAFSLFLIYYKNQKAEIGELKKQMKKPSGNSMLAFRDESGKVKFSMQSADVLYLEAADNYVSVYYLSGNDVRREMLRNTMKSVESMVEGSTVFRCHRSFMVNRRKIEFLRNEGKKLMLQLKHVEKVLPVSKKYSPLFLGFSPQAKAVRP